MECQTEQWKMVMKSELPKKYWKFQFQMRVNFEAVNLELRPAFLWDLFPLKLHSFHTLIAKLKHKGLLQKDIKVTSMADELFLVNTKKLKRILRAVIDHKLFLPVINVGHSNSPVLCDSANLCDIATNIEQILTSVKPQNEPLSLQLDPEWSVPTVVGLCLGFPVLYWVDPMEPPGAMHNTLNEIPLCVYHVKGSFMDRQIDKFISFSIPENLSLKFQDHIEKWFTNNVNLLPKQHFFRNLQLTKEVIMQANVIL